MEHRVFQKLVGMVPNLLDRVLESEAELIIVAELVRIHFAKFTI